MFDQFGYMCLDVYKALKGLNGSIQFDSYVPVVILEGRTLLYGLLTLALFLVALLLIPMLCGIIWATDFIKTRYLKHSISVRTTYDPVECEYNKQRDIIGHVNTSRKEKTEAYKRMCDILKEYHIPYVPIDLDQQSFDVVLKSMPRLPYWSREYLPIDVAGDFSKLNDPSPYKTLKGMRTADVTLRILLTVSVILIYVIFLVPVLFILF